MCAIALKYLIEMNTSQRTVIRNTAIDQYRSRERDSKSLVTEKIAQEDRGLGGRRILYISIDGVFHR